MSRMVFTLIWVAIVVVVLLAMYYGWRARARRDAGVVGSGTEPVGAVVAEFNRISYVSTTPVGDPLVRVAAPGLRYRGRADVTVFQDGVSITVDGERAVYLAGEQVIGAGVASSRVGKVVEQEGLSLLQWRSGDRSLESSFRLIDASEQQRFTEAITQIAGENAPVTTASRSQDSQENDQ